MPDSPRHGVIPPVDPSRAHAHPRPSGHNRASAISPSTCARPPPRLQQRQRRLQHQRQRRRTLAPKPSRQHPAGTTPPATPRTARTTTPPPQNPSRPPHRPLPSHPPHPAARGERTPSKARQGRRREPRMKDAAVSHDAKEEEARRSGTRGAKHVGGEIRPSSCRRGDSAVHSAGLLNSVCNI